MKETILIIKLSAIGDVLMATPAFSEIRKANPGAKISLLIGKWSKPIVENNPNIDEVIEIDENIFWKFRVLPLLKLYVRLLVKKFDTIYVMHWSKLFNFLAFMLGARNRIGFDRDGRSHFLTKKVFFKEGVKDNHVTERYLQMGNDNIDKLDKQLQFFISDKEIELSKQILFGNNISSVYIAIAPGGGVNPKSTMSIRQWPIDNFIKVIERILNKLDLSVVLLGSNSEIPIGDIITNVIKNKRLFDFTGKYDLRITAGILKQSKLLIANDSGLMHLAAAVGVTTISIFGPTAPWDKVPIVGNHHFFYSQEPCSPCYEYGSFPYCNDQKCFKNIKPEDVYNKAADLLKYMRA